jgi:signal transduction histidine kinase
MIRDKRVQWLADNKDKISSDMLGDLKSWYTPWERYPSETTIWALKKIININSKHNSQYPDLKKDIEKAKRIIKREKISTAVAAAYSDDWPTEKWISCETNQPLYAFKLQVGEKSALLIRTLENMRNWIIDNQGDNPIKVVHMQLMAPSGKLILSSPGIIATIPFSHTNFNEHFPGWHLKFSIKDDDIFKSTSQKQVGIYLWTAILVILLILISGAIATQAINRQVKTNRLKNDFIATATHELKTPLASMRVLVDTLLSGHTTDPQQAHEYLELIAKENLRLSRLIDNFLTFSRMERNKRAFDRIKADPGEIVNAAADAMQTKFNHNSCLFNMTIDDHLPSIMSDKDAMVTVLVNLLDNAYKYSYDNKKIELNVFAESQQVCFSVKDNGIGMTRKQQKKIFNRFYQADSSLSRQAEGTGLGLSIVKFIIDAHKGKMTIDSEPGNGSEFIVKIPRSI